MTNKPENPFSLVHASDFSDEQINDLWVENDSLMEQVIEPGELRSKLILGGKGSGKTHLLRYYCYPAMRLRHVNSPAINVVEKAGFIGVFLRATGMDAARFQSVPSEVAVWQNIFGSYLELQLAELLLDSLIDISSSASVPDVDQGRFVSSVTSRFTGDVASLALTLEGLRSWVIERQLELDHAVNNAAFTGRLDVISYFSVGGLSGPIARDVGLLHPQLRGCRVIYMIDEMENFSKDQQVVVNSLIRYARGHCTYRLSGRLYSMLTRETLGGLEENREGAEYKTSYLDEIMRGMKSYPTFADKFIEGRMRRVGASFHSHDGPRSARDFFEEIDRSDFYSAYLQKAIGEENLPELSGTLERVMEGALPQNVEQELYKLLCEDLPYIVARLNVLLFCKRWRRSGSPIMVAAEIRQLSLDFVSAPKGKKLRSSYGTAYNHWSSDIFAQVCRESGRAVPYAGMATFIKMSSCNPRSLLVLLGHAYSVATFRGSNFLHGRPLPVEYQTDGAREAASFMFESDTHFGRRAEQARKVVARLCEVLRVARFSINIPEVSPLTISFSDSELTDAARDSLRHALNYSLVFEVKNGRPDRNSLRKDRKIQINPMLSPKWGLPIARRGDIFLRGDVVNSIFDIESSGEFEAKRKALESKWGRPFLSGKVGGQGVLIK